MKTKARRKVAGRPDWSSMKLRAFSHEDALVGQIRGRITAAGESVWQRHPLPWTHPSFKSIGVAARHLMSMFHDVRTVLVMRDQCLRHVREAVLLQGKNLVIPLRRGTGLLEIPRTALDLNPYRAEEVLQIDPPPRGTKAFSGSVDLVVVACLAFDRRQPRLYTFELERTAYILDELQQGMGNGWRLLPSVPVVAVASDQQEVTNWPAWAQGFTKAHLVVTPTRVIALGSDDVVALDTNRKEVCDVAQHTVGEPQAWLTGP